MGTGKRLSRASRGLGVRIWVREAGAMKTRGPATTLHTRSHKQPSLLLQDWSPWVPSRSTTQDLNPVAPSPGQKALTLCWKCSIWPQPR